MNISGVIGKKADQKQAFLESGERVVLTVLQASGNVVSQIKTSDRDGYNAVQIGFDLTKRANRAILGHTKKAGLQQTPRFFREIRADDLIEVELGSTLAISDILKPGDIVNVTGTSKGKGFAGVVKRHHFRGGPRTHGQSDRERAPGSIGQTTTPGRVYRGKRMAGHMGANTVTVKNLEVIDVMGDTVLVKGLVPGPRGAVLIIVKVGKNKKFVPLFKKAEAVVEEVAEEVLAEAASPQEEDPVEESKNQNSVEEAAKEQAEDKQEK